MAETWLATLLEEKPKNWDPTPAERTYYRHQRTGDLGWLVRREGVDSIRYDRPSQDIVVPFKQGEWVADRAEAKFTRHQVVMVAFEADKKLCSMLGLHDLSRKDWLSLRQEERIAWIDAGPAAPAIRARLYRAIMSTLGEESR